MDIRIKTSDYLLVVMIHYDLLRKQRYVAAFVFPSARCVKCNTETRNECYCRSKCVSTSTSAKLKNIVVVVVVVVVYLTVQAIVSNLV
uniref:Transmembrane protein n=1 Tax=Glossina brevipalpis TaxID=37001 RepID=A0A1A9X2U5_9MUSC